jgi:hypothetical protein
LDIKAALHFSAFSAEKAVKNFSSVKDPTRTSPIPTKMIWQSNGIKGKANVERGF